MQDILQLLHDVRDIGENVVSTGRDVGLLLHEQPSSEYETIRKFKHTKDLVDNVILLLASLSAMDLSLIDQHEELRDEARRIEYASFGLQSVLSHLLNNLITYSECTKEMKKYLYILIKSANRIVTITFIAKQSVRVQDTCMSCEREESCGCYDDIETCREDCGDGVCYKDETREAKCPEYTESFTKSSLTNEENGYEGEVPQNWHNTQANEEVLVQGDEEKCNNTREHSLDDKYHELTAEQPELLMSEATSDVSNEFCTTEEPSDRDGVTDLYNYETTTEEPTTPSLECSSSDADSSTIEDTTYSYETTPEYISTEEPTTPSFETTESTTVDETTTFLEMESYTSPEPTTETYETTTTSYETTTISYETTTQDLYKISQDVYSVAQDLSTKANEISSMSSDISSKVSAISSMISDLNTYDDDDLSKKIQSANKITQEISSKTSELSSLCSTTSSLASDISSASSDMTSADRNHPFRTSPWQKISTKSQDMITSTQAIISAAQDILVKVDAVIAVSADMKVAEAVATAAYEVTAKTQLVISETLNIVSAVIELMNVLDT